MIRPLEQLWREIEATPRHRAAGWLRRLANPGAAVPAHAAVSCLGSARSLMFDIPVAALGKLQDLPATRGLAVSLVSPLEGVPASQRTLAVELEDPQFADIFAVFCTDLVEGISRCATAVDAIVLLFRRLDRWQEFLIAATDGLSQSAAIGLFGELWVLRNILVPLGGIGLLESWTGAQRAPQDFVVPGICAIEVKTSQARALSHVRIHGEQQLDDTGLACLFLVCLRVEHDADKGENLNKLVADLRSLASGTPEFSFLLEGLLIKAGWVKQHEHRHEHVRLRVAQQRSFRVDHHFPRLITAALDPGINEIEYQVELKACTACECANDELVSTLAALKLEGMSKR